MANEPKRPAKSRLEQMLDAEDAAYVKLGDPPPPPTSWGPDPIATGVNWAAQQLPAGTPDWLRTVGRFVIPQNAPELALALAMAPIGGPLAARGVPLAAALAKKGIGAGLKRAGLTGLATGAVGGVTGHDPIESGILGAGGRMAGETLGVAAKKAVESQVSKRLFAKVTPNLVKVFKETIGPYLPPNATEQGVIRDVVMDGPSKRVGAALNAAKARVADKPVKALDLKPITDANGVVTYAWPTEAGAFPKQIGPAPPTVQGGNVWPRPRKFEEKLTPGEGLAPYGALESSPRRLGAGEGGKPVVPSDEVPFGELWDKVDEVYQATELAVKEGKTDLVPRLNALKKVRETLVERVDDPELKTLLHDYGVTKSLRDLFWGARGAKAAFGEDVVKELIDEKTGDLTQKGAKVIYDRLNTDAPNIAKQVGETTTQKLADAVGLQTEKGLASPVPGEFVHARFHPGAGGLHPTVGLEGARVSSYPGWEASRKPWELLAPGAVQAVTAQAPLKVLGGGPSAASAEAAPDLEKGVSLPPARLRDPYAVAVAPPAPAAAPAPAPPTAAPAPAEVPWFNIPGAEPPSLFGPGAERPKALELDVRKGEDEPEVFLETTKKAGE